MKKFLMTVVAAMLLAVPSVRAQKINSEAMMQKLEKSDAEIADAKKAAKAATWINRGKVYYEAAAEPTKSLFVQMGAPMLRIACGEPNAVEQVTIPATGATFTAWVYDWFTAYIAGENVVAWRQTRQIEENAIRTALDAYAKAYELDARQASKIKTGLDQIVNFCKQEGNVNIDIAEYKLAAQAYGLAFEAQSQPAFLAEGGKTEPVLLYYAGYMLTADGPSDPVSYVRGEELLNKALEAGYTDEEGNLYYYLFHCYYGQAATAEGAQKDEFLQLAKKALTEGISKYPNNERIIEGFMTLYTREKEMGDTSELIGLIKGAIERDPQSVDMWSSLGLVYYTLKDFDNAIAVGEKVAGELAPEAFDSIYRLGVYYAAKGDAIRDEMRSKEYTSSEQFDADLAASNQAYASAFPWLEKAYLMQPDNKALVETLKQISFTLRDDVPGMMDKYKEYDVIFQKMQ